MQTAKEEIRVNPRRGVDIEIYVYIDGEYTESYDGLLETAEALGVSIDRVKELLISGDEIDCRGKSVTLDIAYDSPYDCRHVVDEGREKSVLFIETSKLRR